MNPQAENPRADNPRAVQVRDLFCAALELPEAEREHFLTTQCADADLRSEVADLLAQSPAPGFLEPPPMEQLLPQAQQFGPYLVREALPTRPPSYRCREPGQPSLVRVELVPGPRDDAALARFATAAYRAAAARLPGLLGTVRHGRLPEATYVAEQLCDGHTLQHELQAELPPTGQLLPPRDSDDFVAACRRLVASLAGTLASLHGIGVVHGDLHLGRIWLDPQGNAHLFGLGLHLLASPHSAATPQLALPTADHDVRSLFGVLADLLVHCPAASPARTALQHLHRRHARRRTPDLRGFAAELAGPPQAEPKSQPSSPWRWLGRWFAGG